MLPWLIFINRSYNLYYPRYAQEIYGVRFYAA